MKLNLKRRHKITRIFANVFRLLLVAAIIGNILVQNWLNLFTAVLTLAFTFLPFFIARKGNIYLPPGFQIVILLFIFASMYLGELQQYYERYWWWDIMLHTISGIIFGFIGFLLTYILNRERKASVDMSPFFIALFSFTFSLSIGTIWEIFEFSMDQIFGLNMQKSGLLDTMTDLIVDAVGAVFTSAIGYAYIKNQEKEYIIKWIRKLFKKDHSVIKE